MQTAALTAPMILARRFRSGVIGYSRRTAENPPLRSSSQRLGRLSTALMPTWYPQRDLVIAATGTREAGHRTSHWDRLWWAADYWSPRPFLRGELKCPGKTRESTNSQIGVATMITANIATMSP